MQIQDIETTQTFKTFDLVNSIFSYNRKNIIGISNFLKIPTTSQFCRDCSDDFRVDVETRMECMRGRIVKPNRKPTKQLIKTLPWHIDEKVSDVKTRKYLLTTQWNHRLGLTKSQTHPGKYTRKSSFWSICCWSIIELSNSFTTTSHPSTALSTSRFWITRWTAALYCSSPPSSFFIRLQTVLESKDHEQECRKLQYSCKLVLTRTRHE